MDVSPPATDEPAPEVKKPKWISGRGDDTPSWKKEKAPKVEVSRFFLLVSTSAC